MQLKALLVTVVHLNSILKPCQEHVQVEGSRSSYDLQQDTILSVAKPTHKPEFYLLGLRDLTRNREQAILDVIARALDSPVLLTFQQKRRQLVWPTR